MEQHRQSPRSRWPSLADSQQIPQFSRHIPYRMFSTFIHRSCFPLLNLFASTCTHSNPRYPQFNSLPHCSINSEIDTVSVRTVANFIRLLHATVFQAADPRGAQRLSIPLEYVNREEWVDSNKMGNQRIELTELVGNRNSHTYNRYLHSSVVQDEIMKTKTHAQNVLRFIMRLIRTNDTYVIKRMMMSKEFKSGKLEGSGNNENVSDPMSLAFNVEYEGYSVSSNVEKLTSELNDLLRTGKDINNNSELFELTKMKIDNNDFSETPMLQSIVSSCDQCHGKAGCCNGSSVIGIDKEFESRVRNRITVVCNETHNKSEARFVIKWSYSGANYVEVAGSFTDPPWDKKLPMMWCSNCRVHWLDIHEAVSHLSYGYHQLKYIVDGIWMCDSKLPTTDDGKHNINNVVLIPPGNIVLSCVDFISRSFLHQEQGSKYYFRDEKACNENISTSDMNIEARDLEVDNDIGVCQSDELRDDKESGLMNKKNFELRQCMPFYGNELQQALVAEDVRRITSLSLEGWPRAVTKRLHNSEVLLNLPVVDNRRRSGLTFQAASCSIPHPEKHHYGGADSFFISNDVAAVGIADGVGEWDSFGLNPRKFADELMAGCREMANHSEIAYQDAAMKAQNILIGGYEKVVSFGSSTALVACLDKEGQKLGIANLGDSGLILLRRHRPSSTMSCVYRTKEQQHHFNCPFQLSRIPLPSEYESLIMQGNGTLVTILETSTVLAQDTPDMADISAVEVYEGDLILLGTDGVFDNLFDHEICALTNLALSPYEGELLNDLSLVTSAQAVATSIAEAAVYKSQNTSAKTPFMKSARQCGVHFIGGKLDDVTVVACWIVRKDYSVI